MKKQQNNLQYSQKTNTCILSISSSYICYRSSVKYFYPSGTRLIFLASRDELVLLPNLHKKHSCASVFFNPPSSMSFSTTHFPSLWSPFESLATSFFAFPETLLYHPSSPHPQTIIISALSRVFYLFHACCIINCFITHAISECFSTNHT